MKIKVLAITGIRSEYDILYPIIDALRKDKGFEVKVVVCGTHLSDWHGVTLKKVEEDGFEIADKIDYLLMTNRKTQRAKGAGILTSALAQTVERENPDFLLVVGDREESIASAIVGNYMDVLVAHVSGGDPVYGNADDPIRFAVSKLAHVHFIFAKEYTKNLAKIGEEKFRIFWTGNPALDHIRNAPDLRFEKVKEFLKFDIASKNFVVLIKHPLSSEKEKAYSQMKISLKATEEFCNENDVKTVGVYPNTDPGCFDIVKAIGEFRNSKSIRFYKMLPRDIFVNLMRNTLAVAGNSSMGILEAPFYKLPVVNIGDRQKGRLHAGNVEFVKHDKNAIKKALLKACFDKQYRARVGSLQNIYGKGDSSERIKEVLRTIDRSDKRWYVKRKLC